VRRGAVPGAAGQGVAAGRSGLGRRLERKASMTSPSPTAQRRVDELVAHVVGEYVSELQRGYLDDHSVAVAALAQLRRGAGKLIQDVPDLWGVCGTERLYADEDGLHHNQPEHVQ